MVENPASHFTTAVLPGLQNTLSCLNEELVFDCKAAIDHVRNFWLVRYSAAHPITRPVFTIWSTFFESVLGVGAFVSQETMEYCNEHKQELFSVTSAMNDLLESVKGTNG